jgi:hypothetical protein
MCATDCCGKKVAWTWGREKNLFEERFFFPGPTCPAIACGDGGTPTLSAKPFLGIYLFAYQKDKCP